MNLAGAIILEMSWNEVLICSKQNFEILFLKQKKVKSKKNKNGI